MMILNQVCNQVFCSGVFLAVLLLTNTVYGQQRSFPYVAKPTVSEVNVRSGPSVNFETLTRLSSGQSVVVLDHSYSWYKIRLPLDAKSFISSEFVSMIDDGEGEVTGSRVNVRSGPGLIHTILGQAKKGDRVYVVDEHEEWLRIEPLDGTFGWVAEDLIKFSSSDVAAFDRRIRDMRLERKRKKLEEARKIAEQERLKQLELMNLVETEGYIEPVLDPERSDLAYKLVVDGRTKYYLDGVEYILDDLLFYKVRVEGEKMDQGDQVMLYPLVKISKIELIP
jgi:SH3-like domain-containing protein